MQTVPGLAVGLGGVPTLPEGKCRGCRQGTEKGLLFAERDTEVGPENLPSAPPPPHPPAPPPAYTLNSKLFHVASESFHPVPDRRQFAGHHSFPSAHSTAKQFYVRYQNLDAILSLNFIHTSLPRIPSSSLLFGKVLDSLQNSLKRPPTWVTVCQVSSDCVSYLCLLLQVPCCSYFSCFLVIHCC